ncbi:MAG: helix-turn-helix domain-containing protein [Methylococcales bacterium]
MSKRINPNKVKIHRSYTVEEVACLLPVHKNTVRIWVKDGGLPVCDSQKPMLILGRVLREFLQSKNKKKKHKCKPNEMYCLRCKSPQKPAENMVDYEPITEVTGRLIALCSCCECVINKYTSLANLEKNKHYFTDGTKAYKQEGLAPLKQ